MVSFSSTVILLNNDMSISLLLLFFFGSDLSYLPLTKSLKAYEYLFDIISICGLPSMNFTQAIPTEYLAFV